MSAVKMEKKLSFLLLMAFPCSKLDNLRYLWSRKAGGAKITSLFIASLRVFSGVTRVQSVDAYLSSKQKLLSRRPNLAPSTTTGTTFY